MAPLTFLLLPLEVRTIIYTRYFTDTASSSLPSHPVLGPEENPYVLLVYFNDLDETESRRWTSNLPLRLLHTCQQLREEALPLVSAQCTLWLTANRHIHRNSTEFNKVIHSLPPVLVNGVKQLKISEHAFLGVYLDLSPFRGLQRVVIDTSEFGIDTMDIGIAGRTVRDQAGLAMFLRGATVDNPPPLELDLLSVFDEVVPRMNRPPGSQGLSNETGIFVYFVMNLWFRSRDVNPIKAGTYKVSKPPHPIVYVLLIQS